MTNVAQTPHHSNLDATLRTLAAQARTRYAGEAARIDRGLVIALGGGVTLKADAALVSSQQGDEVFYIVRDGHCDCPDFPRAPGGRCKHRFAVCLVKRALKQEHEAQAVRYFATYTAEETQMADYCIFQGTETRQIDGHTMRPAAAEAWYWEPGDYEGDTLWSEAFATREEADEAAQDGMADLDEAP